MLPVATADVFWVLVNCNSANEAVRIGDAVLAARHAACFDVFPRTLTRYFWPPRSGERAEGAGALLVLETIETHIEAVKAVVRRHHSDQLPFIGALRMERVDQAFRQWVADELAPLAL